MSNHRSDELNPSNSHPGGTRQLSADPHGQPHSLHPAASSASWQDTSMIAPPVSYYDPSNALDHQQQQDIWQQWDQATGYPGASATDPSSYHSQVPSPLNVQHQYSVSPQPSYDPSNQHQIQAASTDISYRFGAQSSYQNPYTPFQQHSPPGASQAAQRFEEYYRSSDPVQNAPMQRLQQQPQQHISHIVHPRAPATSQVQQQQQQHASLSQSQKGRSQQHLNVPTSSFTFQSLPQPGADQFYPSADPLQTQPHATAEGGYYWPQQAVRATSISPGASAPGSTTASSFPGSARASNTHSPPSSYPSTTTPTSTSTTDTNTTSSSSLSAAQGPPRAPVPAPSGAAFAMGHVSHSSADTVRSRPTATAGRYTAMTTRQPPGQRTRRIMPTQPAQAGGSGASKRGRPAAAGNGGGSKANKRRREAKAAWDDGEGSDGSDEDEDDEDEREGKRGADTKRLGACQHCKQLKMKCNFPPGAIKCERCAHTGHECFIPQRKTKQNPAKREYLLAQIKQKDQVIDTLLKQLHNPYIATPLSISSFKLAESPSDENKENVLEWFNRLHGSVHGPTRPQGPDLKGYAQPGPSEAASDSGEGEEAEAEPDSDDTPSVLPDDAVPIGLLASLSLDRQKKKGVPEVDSDENVGVANAEYFRPGPATNLSARKHLIEQNAPPDIVVHNLVTPEDVDKLFVIYYEKLNPFVHLLDPVLHTPKTIFHRCPFLYTVICAISSRYYPEKSEIYPIAMHFAKHSAATALIDGWKSVELCQAYILMSIYGVPARRWEEDRSWLYTGLAIRIATDLNLHKLPTTQPQSDRQIREMLNRTRVWLICHNIDRSTATQFGKPLTIKEDYIIKNSADWYKRTEQNHPYDVHLCAYAALMRILTRFIEEVYSDPSTPTGLNKRIDYLSLALRYDEELDGYHREWEQRFNEMLDPNDPIAKFRVTLLPFMTYYSKLVVYSFGFQQAFERGMRAADDIFFKKCFEGAKSVIAHMINVAAPSGYLRYAPDGHFIFASFASAFLLKLLRPEFLHLLTPEMESEIFDVIHQLINVFDSDQVAIDERHTPKLYARFLTVLLSRHRKGGAAMVANRQPQFPPGSQSVDHSPPSGQNMAGPSFTSGSQSTPPSDQPGPVTRDPDAMQMRVGASVDVQAAAMSQYPMPADVRVPDDPILAGGAGVAEDTVMFNVDDLSQLAPMRAITSNLENFWNNMMLPGFTWTDGPGTPNSQGGYTGFPGYQNGFADTAFPLVGASL